MPGELKLAKTISKGSLVLDIENDFIGATQHHFLGKDAPDPVLVPEDQLFTSCVRNQLMLVSLSFALSLPLSLFSLSLSLAPAHTHK